MKKITFTLITVFIITASFAQTGRQLSIQDTILGWQKVYNYGRAIKPETANKRVYSIEQISTINLFVNWIQASYVPKGGIGDIKKAAFPRENEYAPYNAALPQGYGATAYTWSVAYNPKGELERIQETEFYWNVLANKVPGWPIPDISTTTHYYFTMPALESSDDAYLKQQDLSYVPSFKPYIYFGVASLETGGGDQCVLLCKDNKSPFIKLTKGEYLALLDAAIARAYEAEKKKILSDYKDNQRSIDNFMKSLDEKNAKRLANLKSTKEKYKNRLQEIAEVNKAQPGIMLENINTDVFDNYVGSKMYPVYTIAPEMYELCKKDKPQWILFSWRYTPSEPNEKHMHEAIINNFNFDYVYNYFFDPEKVKGKKYQPLHSPYEKEKVVNTESSIVSKKNALDFNIHFYEDFSTTAVGKKPIGWYVKAGFDGHSSIVTIPEGASGNWVEIKGNTIIPNLLKKPLPINFNLSFDVAVPQNFTWGAKALKVALSKQKPDGTDDASFLLSLKPGYSGGTDGSAYVETKLPVNYTSGSSFVAPGFSVNKDFNRISVTIIKDGEAMQVWIDKNKVAEYIKGVPADMLFNALSFSMIRSDGETEKYFVSNIKITKE